MTEKTRARVAELEAELDALCEAEGFPRLLSERVRLIAERDALDHQLQRAQADYGWAVVGARRMKMQRDAWRAATGCKGMTPEAAGERLDALEERLEAERDALRRRVDAVLALYRKTGRWNARPARILRGEGDVSPDGYEYLTKTGGR